MLGFAIKNIDTLQLLQDALDISGIIPQNMRHLIANFIPYNDVDRNTNYIDGSIISSDSLNCRYLFATPILLHDLCEEELGLIMKNMEYVMDDFLISPAICSTGSFSATIKAPFHISDLLRWIYDAICDLTIIDEKSYIFYHRKQHIVFSFYMRKLVHLTEKEGKYLDYIMRKEGKITGCDIKRDVFNVVIMEENKIDEVYYEKIRKKLKNNAMKCPIIKYNKEYRVIGDRNDFDL